VASTSKTTADKTGRHRSGASMNDWRGVEYMFVAIGQLL
jgi:hypothetical protein